MKIGYLSRDEVVSEARDLYSRWPSSFREKRTIVESIVGASTSAPPTSRLTYYLPEKNSALIGNRSSRIHRRDQHEARRVGHAMIDTRDSKPLPASSGWRSESSACGENSGSSSRNSTP